MVSVRHVSRPSRLATSAAAACGAQHDAVALNLADRLHRCAAGAGPAKAAMSSPQSLAMRSNPPDLNGFAAMLHDEAAGSARCREAYISEVRDSFCCKKFPAPIAAKKVPHYITHYRALINQLTDPHLTECGD
jgi:hypothetical protein